MEADSGVLATGRVLQVNVSMGGVPKRPVERAWVGKLGLEGDKHRENTLHGGPHQAVCLFGMEAIERFQSEGHPVEPGSVGENLTTSGIEWSLLAVGTRARIGDQLEIEISSSTTPCKTQTQNFLGGDFSRMLIDRHPSDSRMYARVLSEGEVKPGDLITVTSASDSRADDELLLKRLDRAESRSSLAAWQAAAESGFDVRIVVNGELYMAASPEVRGPAFNRASGLARMPQLLPMVTKFFDKLGGRGWLIAEDEPWAGADAAVTTGVFGAAAEAVREEAWPTGLSIRPIKAEDGATVMNIHSASGSVGVDEDQRNPWAHVYERLATHPQRTVLIAELDGQPVGAASVHTNAGVGWLRGASVVPTARGKGIQRALLSARARIATERGCDLLGAWAEPDGPSAANLVRMGMRQVGVRHHFVYNPAASPNSTGTGGR